MSARPASPAGSVPLAREDRLAGRDRGHAGRQRPPRTDAVGGEADRHLHREVDAELDRGERR
jgi:hypothetical protein